MEWSSHHIDKPKSSFVSRLEDIVGENLTNEQFSVEDLAKRTALSRSHLHRKLKKATGQSISQFIREYRLKKAHELLLNEEITSSEVAFKVGFGSATYFNKAFHDFYGYTPGETRNKGHIRPKEKKKKIWFSGLELASGGIILIILFSTFFVLFNEKRENARQEKSIAVLPFKTLSTQEENEYFADGVMVAILQKLSSIDELKVISRTSAEKYKNTSKTIPQIAEELGVTYILEGSAQKVNDEINISTQLINTENDNYVWSKIYTREFKDILLLQNDIAENIAKELVVKLSDNDKKVLRKMTTNNVEAYNYYLQAEFQRKKFSERAFKNAIPLYEKAINLDSGFVDPYVGLATVFSTGGLIWGIFNQEEAYRNASGLLEKALTIDPDHYNALNDMGSASFYFEWDFDKARSYINKINKIRGVYNNFSSDFYIKMNEPKKALSLTETHIRLDPSNSTYYIFNAEANFFLGDTAKAIEIFDKATNLYEDQFILREAAKLYYYFGEIEKSKKALEKHYLLYSDRPPIMIWLQAIHSYHENKPHQQYIDQLLELYQNGSSGSPAWFLALYYAVKGNKDKTFEWLQKSYNKREVEMTWLKMEPLLHPYKEDNRYKALVDKIGFPDGKS
ncbi:MAG: helix-turn-helix domain-containing protein [Candidatus Cyclobacteriaceae bacterium M2_1C_046]